MANRRMFSLSIIDTDQFLNLPATAQNLYFHLSMRADDDGFVSSPQKIIKFVGANNGDLQTLIDNNYVILLANAILVITHWRIHNYIQNDRYHPTLYKEEKALLEQDENGAYVLNEAENKPCIHGCIQDVSKMDTEVRLGKDRLGKVSLDKDNIYENLVEIYNKYCTKLPKVQKLTSKRKTEIKKYLKEFSEKEFEEECIIANQSEFLTGNNTNNWKASFDFLIRTDKAAKILEGDYRFTKTKKQGWDYIDEQVDVVRQEWEERKCKEQMF